MRSSVGFIVMGGGGGKRERRGGGGGGKGKRGVVLIGVGDGGVGIRGMERAAESWWDNVRVSSSSCTDRRVVSGSRVSSSSVSEWEGSEGESVGEGTCGLGKNQRGFRVGGCEMVGDYYDDSSVKENLNLLLRLARVETNVDSKINTVTLGSGRDKRRLKDNEGTRFLEGLLQELRMLGASAAALSND